MSAQPANKRRHLARPPAANDASRRVLPARQALFRACRSADRARALALLDEGADASAARAYDGATPLIAASEWGEAGLVRALLAAGADPTVRDRWGRTAMHVAVWERHEGVAEALAEHAGPDRRAAWAGALGPFRSSGLVCSPLVDAVESGNVQMARVLVGAGCDAKTAGGDTPLLIRACESGLPADSREGILRVLLEGGADVNQANGGGWTSLMFASSDGHEGVARMLLEGGADVNQAEEDGSTALMVASQSGHEGVVCALVARGAAVTVNARTPYCPSALSLACRRGHLRVAAHLVGAGAAVGVELAQPVADMASLSRDARVWLVGMCDAVPTEWRTQWPGLRQSEVEEGVAYRSYREHRRAAVLTSLWSAVDSRGAECLHGVLHAVVAEYASPSLSEFRASCGQS